MSVWQDKEKVTDGSTELETSSALSVDDPSLDHVAPELRPAFVSGHAPVHDVARLPTSFHGAHNGHEGSHQFLVDDFVHAVTPGSPATVNPWVAARFTLPGIIAHESALRGGERLSISDFGDPPASLSR